MLPKFWSSQKKKKKREVTRALTWVGGFQEFS